MIRNAKSVTLACALAASAGAHASWAQTLTNLFSFPDATFQAYPNGLIKGPGSTLIGSTNYLPGNIFELTPPAAAGGAWTETSLVNFDLKHNGIGMPSGSLVYMSNSIYGVTEVGGDTQNNENCRQKTYTGCGAIFRLIAPAAPGGTWVSEAIYTFAGSPDGAFPYMLTPVNGGFLGVTQMGGNLKKCGGPEVVPGCGTVFQLMPPAAAGQPWTESVLYAFQGDSDSRTPETIMVAANGMLIGTTYGSGTSDNGTVFQLTPPAPNSPAGTYWTKTILYRFAGGSDCSGPVGNLTAGSNGELYGVCMWGGAAGVGAVYQLTPPTTQGHPWTEQLVHSFLGGSDGSNPSAGVLRASNGSLFGATAGTWDSTQSADVNGTIYRLDPPAMAGGTWTETVLYLFADPTIGSQPCALIFGGSQMLLGLTKEGGSLLEGTVFELTAGGL